MEVLVKVVPLVFPAASRRRALVGVTGLLTVGFLGIASTAYSAITAPPPAPAIMPCMEWTMSSGVAFCSRSGAALRRTTPREVMRRSDLHGSVSV
ncbi:hypothetical protein ACVWYO_004318 [Sphingomonas sp. UYP23]